MNKSTISFLSFFVLGYFFSIVVGGCAQIGAPTGGPRDTTAPKLIKAFPSNEALHFSANKITLHFDEFIDVKDFQNNAMISPLPKNNPTISSNLKTITIKLRDTLQPNTTYAIDFGNAIRDINEGNVAAGFRYVFSTGNQIDTLKIKGKILLAESGKVDSTVLVLLYRNTSDTAVQHQKPDYITKVNGNGTFMFSNLPNDVYRVYALKDGDGNKYYSLATEVFAFHEIPVNASFDGDSVMLFAYAEKKETQVSSSNTKPADKKLRYTSNLSGTKQDLLLPLELSFNNTIKTFSADSIALYDTNFHPIVIASIQQDTNHHKISINSSWVAEQNYVLVVNAGAVNDSLGNTIAKNDTLRFRAKSKEDYGSIKITFQNIDIARHPILQFMEGENIKWSFTVSGNEWTKPMMLPGEYEVRLLYDDNNNGKWDPGNFNEKIQPEKAVTLPQKIAVRANWDNEREVIL